MHPRRTRALAVGALLLATSALSSCGFDLATDEINTTQHGATNRDKSVNVLAGVIIADAPGSGTLSAQLVNNDSEPTELTTIDGGEGTLTVSEIEPTEIPVRGAVSVAEVGDGIRVDGDFIAGNIVPMTMTFSNGDQVSLQVPVVKPCDEYADVEQAPAIGSGSSETTSESESESAEAYSCETHEEEGH